MRKNDQSPTDKTTNTEGHKERNDNADSSPKAAPFYERYLGRQSLGAIIRNASALYKRHFIEIMGAYLVSITLLTPFVIYLLQKRWIDLSNDWLPAVLIASVLIFGLVHSISAVSVATARLLLVGRAAPVASSREAGGARPSELFGLGWGVTMILNLVVTGPALLLGYVLAGKPAAFVLAVIALALNVVVILTVSTVMAPAVMLRGKYGVPANRAFIYQDLSHFFRGIGLIGLFYLLAAGGPYLLIVLLRPAPWWLYIPAAAAVIVASPWLTVLSVLRCYDLIARLPADYLKEVKSGSSGMEEATPDLGAGSWPGPFAGLPIPPVGSPRFESRIELVGLGYTMKNAKDIGFLILCAVIMVPGFFLMAFKLARGGDGSFTSSTYFSPSVAVIVMVLAFILAYALHRNLGKRIQVYPDAIVVRSYSEPLLVIARREIKSIDSLGLDQARAAVLDMTEAFQTLSISLQNVIKISRHQGKPVIVSLIDRDGFLSALSREWGTDPAGMVDRSG